MGRDRTHHGGYWLPLRPDIEAFADNLSEAHAMALDYTNEAEGLGLIGSKDRGFWVEAFHRAALYYCFGSEIDEKIFNFPAIRKQLKEDGYLRAAKAIGVGKRGRPRRSYADRGLIFVLAVAYEQTGQRAGTAWDFYAGESDNGGIETPSRFMRLCIGWLTCIDPDRWLEPPGRERFREVIKDARKALEG